IEALEADTVGAAIGRYVGLVLLLAATNGIARLGARFAIMGGAQRIEHDLRNDLYASLQRFRPAEIARRTTGDLMTRATSDAGAVRSLVGFGVVSFVGTVAAFVGAVTAMVSVDPWLTLAAFVPLAGVITGLGALIVLWLGGRQVIAGQLSLGALVAFNGYLAYLAWPTLALGWTLSLVRRGLTSMARVQEIVDAVPALATTANDEVATPRSEAPALSFRNLTFA